MGVGFDEMAILADVPGDVINDGVIKLMEFNMTGELAGWMTPYVFSSRACVAAR